MKTSGMDNKVFRADTLGVLRSPRMSAEGFLTVDGFAARTGIQVYVLPDGTVRRELRPDSEVLRDDSMATLHGKPVTLNHPATLLTPDIASRHQKGAVIAGPTMVLSPATKRTLLGVSISVTDAAAITAATTTHQQLSCGYTCSIDETPGEWNGEKYDCVQRDISYNHLALVERARGGNELSVKLDEADADAMPTAVFDGTNERIDTMSDTNILIGGKTVRVDADAAPMLLEIGKRADAAADIQKRLDSALADVEKQRGEVDAVKVQLAKATAELAETQKRADAAVSPEVIAKAIAERAPLVELAKVEKVDGADALDNAKLRAAIFEKATGKRADSVSADYVLGFVDRLVATRGDSAATLAKDSPTIPANTEGAKRVDASDPDAAQRQYEAQMAKAHVIAPK